MGYNGTGTHQDDTQWVGYNGTGTHRNGPLSTGIPMFYDGVQSLLGDSGGVVNSLDFLPGIA